MFFTVLYLYSIRMIKKENITIITSIFIVSIFWILDAVFGLTVNVSGNGIFLRSFISMCIISIGFGVAGFVYYLKESQVSVSQANNDWEETFNGISEAITIHDSDFNIIRANKTAEKMLGIPGQMLLSQKCYKSYHGLDSPPAICPSCTTMKTGIPSTREVFEPLMNKHLEIKAFPRLINGIHFAGVIHVVRDITARKKLEEELRELSYTDELTGLYNRRGFFMLAEQQLKAVKRRERDAILLYADLDGLKTINDRWGHREGDTALKETASFFRELFRESDIIARIGGDEFVVLLEESGNFSANTLENRFKAHLEMYNSNMNNAGYRLSVSIGIVSDDKAGFYSLDELMAKADHLMYEKKMKRSLMFC